MPKRNTCYGPIFSEAVVCGINNTTGCLVNIFDIYSVIFVLGLFITVVVATATAAATAAVFPVVVTATYGAVAATRLTVTASVAATTETAFGEDGSVQTAAGKISATAAFGYAAVAEQTVANRAVHTIEHFIATVVTFIPAIGTYFATKPCAETACHIKDETTAENERAHHHTDQKCKTTESGSK